MRSFRAEHVSSFVKAVLDCERSKAREIFESISSRYPIALTRDLNKAKQWIRAHARGSERFGMVASSGAQRLKPHAIDVRVEINAYRVLLTRAHQGMVIFVPHGDRQDSTRTPEGGEVAADKLTGYLKPARFTLYVEGKPDRLILANRLRPDVNGEIEILEAFWAKEETRQPDDVAPPLVVYADLMATTDPRNIEAANMIRDKYLAQILRAA